MDLPELHMWERAALKPSERSTSNLGSARRGRARTPDPSARELRRARCLRARIRAATVSGFFMSGLLSVPVGWSFVQSTFLAEGGAAVEECPELASLLAPNLQSAVRSQRTAEGLSLPARQTLNAKVCGQAVQAMLRPLLEGVSDMQGLRDLAKGGPVPNGDMGTLPALMTVLAQPRPQGP